MRLAISCGAEFPPSFRERFVAQCWSQCSFQQVNRNQEHLQRWFPSTWTFGFKGQSVTLMPKSMDLLVTKSSCIGKGVRGERVKLGWVGWRESFGKTRSLHSVHFTTALLHFLNVKQRLSLNEHGVCCCSGNVRWALCHLSTGWEIEHLIKYAKKDSRNGNALR